MNYQQKRSQKAVRVTRSTFTVTVKLDRDLFAERVTQRVNSALKLTEEEQKLVARRCASVTSRSVNYDASEPKRRWARARKPISQYVEEMLVERAAGDLGCYFRAHRDIKNAPL